MTWPYFRAFLRLILLFLFFLSYKRALPYLWHFREINNWALICSWLVIWILTSSLRARLPLLLLRILLVNSAKFGELFTEFEHLSFHLKIFTLERVYFGLKQSGLLLCFFDFVFQLSYLLLGGIWVSGIATEDLRLRLIVSVHSF